MAGRIADLLNICFTRRTLGLALTAGLVALLAVSAGFVAGKSPAASGGTTAASVAGPASESKGSKTRSAPVKKKRSKVRFKVSRRHINVGQKVELHGRAKPGGKRPFKVVVKGPDGSVFKRQTSERGRFVRAWAPSRPGVYRLRSFSGANRHAHGSVGPSRRLVVYRPANASWFGPGFYGNRTACGQTLTPGMIGVAHKTLPCGTKLKLRHKGRRINVRVIDRGPFIPGREFDLTYATKEKLGFGDLGTVYASR